VSRLVIGSDGLVVTHHDVVEGATEVTVTVATGAGRPPVDFDRCR
jgi:S1-C subfamily serine protease